MSLPEGTKLFNPVTRCQWVWTMLDDLFKSSHRRSVRIPAGPGRIHDAVADILQVRWELLPWLSDGRIGFGGLSLIE